MYRGASHICRALQECPVVSRTDSLHPRVGFIIDFGVRFLKTTETTYLSVQVRNFILGLLFPRDLESETLHLESQLHCRLINSWCSRTQSLSITWRWCYRPHNVVWVKWDNACSLADDDSTEVVVRMHHVATLPGPDSCCITNHPCDLLKVTYLVCDSDARPMQWVWLSVLPQCNCVE